MMSVDDHDPNAAPIKLDLNVTVNESLMTESGWVNESARIRWESFITQYAQEGQHSIKAVTTPNEKMKTRNQRKRQMMMHVRELLHGIKADAKKRADAEAEQEVCDEVIRRQNAEWRNHELRGQVRYLIGKLQQFRSANKILKSTVRVLQVL